MRLRKRRAPSKFYRFGTRLLLRGMRKNSLRAAAAAAGAGAAVFFTLALRDFIFASAYFHVNEIEIIDAHPDTVAYPLARMNEKLNIFSIDLEKISRRLEREHPDIQKAVVHRILPDKLLIKIFRRRPVAQIAVKKNKNGDGQDHFYSINEEGVILAHLGTLPELKLPVVSGSGLTIPEVQPGYAQTSLQVQRAIMFLNELRRSGFLSRYSVSRLDVSAPQSISFVVNNVVEVKIGVRDWPKKIETLAGILHKTNIDYAGGHYIDLRFKDVVVGKK